MAGLSPHLAALLRDPACEPLTDEREAELADVINAARQARAAGALSKRLERQERQARDELTSRSIRLVVTLAQKYRHRVEMDDLVGAGNVALVRAVALWNPELGPLAPWVIRWVRSAMTRLVDASRTIRLPEEIAYRGALLVRKRTELEAAMGREPTTGELAEALGISPVEVDRLTGMPEGVTILDAPIGLGTSTLADTIASDEDPVAAVELRAMKDKLVEACRELSPAEARIVIARFDLADTGERPTLSELGDELNLSREMVRKLEASALAKLRHPALRVELDELLAS